MPNFLAKFDPVPFITSRIKSKEMALFVAALVLSSASMQQPASAEQSGNSLLEMCISSDIYALHGFISDSLPQME